MQNPFKRDKRGNKMKDTFDIKIEDMMDEQEIEKMKVLWNIYLSRVAPDKNYKVISIKHNNKTQKYDIRVEENTTQGKIPVKNTTKD